MILTIFGATGMLGKQLVKQALYKGHTVKAFGRNVFTAGLPEEENLELFQGALFDEQQVLDAVSGSDAVLSALGGSSDGVDKTRSLGMKNIVEQMTKARVSRIVAVGGMGCLDAGPGQLIMDTKGFPPQFIPVSREHLAAYKLLSDSTLAWTFVCPPDLIDAAATGHFHTAANNTPEASIYKINTGDLALFMLNEVEKNDYLLQRVGISN